MNKYFNTQIGLFRTITFMEGISLILLVCIAVPIKYLQHDPQWVKVLGPIHGALFIGFCYMAYHVGKSHNWNWKKMAPIILMASFIPFGTFYFDHTVLKPMHVTATGKQ